MFNILKETELKLFAEKNIQGTQHYKTLFTIHQIYSTGNLISEYKDTSMLFYPLFIYIYNSTTCVIQCERNKNTITLVKTHYSFIIIFQFFYNGITLNL